MIELIKSLEDNIKVINEIDDNRFKALMTTIFERFTDDGPIFSEQEESKWIDVLQINEKKKVNQVINGLVHLVKQIIFTAPKYKTLLSQLNNLGLSDDKTIIIGKVWANSTNEKVEYFKNKCYNFSDCQLKDVNWKMRLQCKQSNSSNLLINKAQIDLILNENQNQDKIVSLEFDHNQLSNFYQELEEIQVSIDSRILQL